MPCMYVSVLCVLSLVLQYVAYPCWTVFICILFCIYKNTTFTYHILIMPVYWSTHDTENCVHLWEEFSVRKQCCKKNCGTVCTREKQNQMRHFKVKSVAMKNAKPPNLNWILLWNSKALIRWTILPHAGVSQITCCVPVWQAAQDWGKWLKAWS